MIVKIGIINKYACQFGKEHIVCGNNDYTIKFEFDAEWDDVEYKTARFVYVQDGAMKCQDVVFKGDTIEGADVVPVFTNIREVLIGVYAGDLQTSTPARVICDKSIRCGTGAPENPPPSQYDQIMALLNSEGYAFDPSLYGLPVLYLNGDTTGISKDDKVTLEYVYGERSGSCTLKWQGSSSLAYEKKNYTICFDNAFEVVAGWGSQKKYCLKANFIDHSHARNVVCAKLWGELVKSRPTKNTLLNPKLDPNSIRVVPNGGAVDGFPIIIVLNDEFHGVYTWNIPKDGWMFGMGSGDREAIVGADESANGDTAFKHTTTLVNDQDGSGFELEYAPDEDDTQWIVDSLNQLITECINSDGSDLDTVIAQHLDWESVIDYLLFTTFVGGSDMVLRNYLMATFDGVKWYLSAYDMDSTFGLKWDGQCFYGAQCGPTFADFKNKHRIMELVCRFKTDALRVRWAQLRNSVFSDSHICSLFENFTSAIPAKAYLDDVKKYPSIPSSAVSSLDQILSWVHQRLAIMDERVEALPASDVPGSPVGANLYNGLSKVWRGKYFYNSSSLNLDTLEVFRADPASSDYCLTRATPVKPSTAYVIPNIVDSAICTYNAEGKYDGTLTATDGVITTKATTKYLVFCFFKPSYTGYESFYIKERNANLFNGLSELWGDRYYYDDTAQLNVDSLELSTAIASPYFCMSKAVAVNPATEYTIPNIGSRSKIVAYGGNGEYQGTLALTDKDGSKVIKTKATDAFLVVCFCTEDYSDFNNFHITQNE